jgi:NADH-quinone oxidoreductase subunit J
MLGNYVVAFEAAAILLLLAVVGAIILARGVEEE